MASSTILPGQLRLILAITAVHVIAWYAFLSQLPLGLYPTPAEQTTIETAFSLAQGLSIEGLSVTVYEFILSIFARFATGESELVLLVRIVNALALILTTTACAHAAGLYWKRNRAVWIAGLLTGLNPVLVFWSAEVSPTLLAVLFSCLSFTLLLRWLKKPTPKRSFMLGLLLCIAVSFETSLIYFVIIWPIAACLYPNRKRAYHLGSALAFPVLALVLFTVSHFQLQTTPETEWSNLGRGVYEVFNSHEVYDGKSYGLHKQLNLFLFVNPLHWGLIFILAMGGAYIRLKNGNKGNSIGALLICVTVFAISYALNDAGSKARSLLYPILAIYAGGTVMLPQVWSHASKLTKSKMIAGLALICALCYSDIYDAREPVNWEADYSFLAKANLKLDRNKSAIEWAEKSIELNPDQDDMRSIIAYATFNLWALSPNPPALPSETIRIYLEATHEASLDEPNIRAIEALYLFKLRESDQAVEIWKEVSDRSALALICLYWTGQIEKPSQNRISTLSEDFYYDLLVQAVGINRNALAYSEGEGILDNMLAIAH